MNVFFTNEPNWAVLTFIGAATGYALPNLFKMGLYIFRLVKDKNFMKGIWYSYYLTYENNVAICKKEIWKVNTGYKKQLKIKVKTLPKGDLNFKGDIEEEGGQLLVKLNAIEFNEKIFGRFTKPIPGNDAIMVGICIGIDFNGFATASPNILSRKKLTEEEVKVHLEKNIEISKKKKLLRIKV